MRKEPVSESGINERARNVGAIYHSIIVQKTTKIRITTTRKTELVVSVSTVRGVCASCNREVQMLTGRDGADPGETSQLQLGELVTLGGTRDPNECQPAGLLQLAAQE